jgi:hypothetical protein
VQSYLLTFKLRYFTIFSKSNNPVAQETFDKGFAEDYDSATQVLKEEFVTKYFQKGWHEAVVTMRASQMPLDQPS